MPISTVFPVENLAQVASTVTDFAAGASLTLLPTVPESGLGPEVRLTPDVMDLPALLALARKLGGGIIHLRAAPFNPETDEHEVDDPPAHLVQHAGEIGQVSVAFMANSLSHLRRQREPCPVLRWKPPPPPEYCSVCARRGRLG